jgi:thiamine-phosphate diphosphorylase
MKSSLERFHNATGRVYCIVDSLLLCGQLLDAGARVIQLRHKTAEEHVFRRMAREMLEMVRLFEDAVLIVNDRVDVAVEVGADGVHVGQADEDFRAVIQRVPLEMIVGVSARYPGPAAAAERAGAAYIGSGSVFATATKPDAVLIGPAGVRAVVAAVKIPVVAIGGISVDNIREAAKTGARFFAAISALGEDPEPGAALRRLEAALRA